MTAKIINKLVMIGRALTKVNLFLSYNIEINMAEVEIKKIDGKIILEVLIIVLNSSSSLFPAAIISMIYGMYISTIKTRGRKNRIMTDNIFLENSSFSF